MVFRHPIDEPVQTSFGVMHERPALFVRITDVDGHVGLGEVWCNFPACGAEHRARLIDTVFTTLLIGQRFDSPHAAFEHLSAATAVLALQSGEPGPMAQCIAGIDLALCDLAACRAGVPLWRWLGGMDDEIEVYASGLNPTRPEALAARKHAEGYRAFKLKVGFGAERDVANLESVRRVIGNGRLMVDANQAWDLAAASAIATRLAPFDLGWVEEPLRADRPWSEWEALKQVMPAPLAAGENLTGHAAFDSLITAGAVSVVQPDVAKWGGHSGCVPVVRRAQAAGLLHCPHYLGAGIGLLHAAHLLAATRGDGMLEIDANDNPLRTSLCGPLQAVSDGRVRLGRKPGIGIDPASLDALRA